MISTEHIEPIRKKDIPELADVTTDDLHILDYDDGVLHCTEIFSHEGAYRGYAKTKDESLQKAVNLYLQSHPKSA